MQKNCEIHLQRLIQVATDTCNITSQLRHLPVSKDKRLQIFQQKKREEEALAAYRKVRAELLEAIESAPDLLYPTEDQSPPQREYGQPRSGMHRRRA
jgi:hypothetical protein